MTLEQKEMVMELISDARKIDRFYLTSREYNELEMNVGYALDEEINKQEVSQ